MPPVHTKLAVYYIYSTLPFTTETSCVTYEVYICIHCIVRIFLLIEFSKIGLRMYNMIITESQQLALTLTQTVLSYIWTLKVLWLIINHTYMHLNMLVTYCSCLLYKNMHSHEIKLPFFCIQIFYVLYS